MFHVNDALFPALGPMWRAFDLFDELAEERLPDRFDQQVRADEDAVTVVAMLPGLDIDSLVVEVDDGVLHINGSRRDLTPEGAKVIRRERERGEYRNLMRLPYEVDDAQAEANYDNGVLTIRLPRAAASKPRRISVQQAASIEHK